MDLSAASWYPCAVRGWVCRTLEHQGEMEEEVLVPQALLVVLGPWGSPETVGRWEAGRSPRPGHTAASSEENHGARGLLTNRLRKGDLSWPP